MKRSPLKRGKPLERGASQLKRTRLKANPSQQQKAHMARMVELRPVVFERDGWACVRCHKTVLGLMDPHHRLPRSLGGMDTLANLVTLCRECHDHVHAHPAESYTAGWLVHAWDPAPSVAWTPPGT